MTSIKPLIIQKTKQANDDLLNQIQKKKSIINAMDSARKGALSNGETSRSMK